MDTHTKIIYDTIGWAALFFLAIRYLPQIYTNFKRKSVTGLAYDFSLISVLYHGYYVTLNIIFFAYGSRKPNGYQDHHIMIPFAFLDIILMGFALMNSLLIFVQIVHYGLFGDSDRYLGTRYYNEYITSYRNDDLKLIKKYKFRRIFFYTKLIILMILFVAIFILSKKYEFKLFLFTEALFLLSLIVSLYRYISQFYLNYNRQATRGWNIYGVLFELCYGLLFVGRFIYIVAINESINDIGNTGIFDFLIGIFAVFFNLIFMIQHFYLYRGQNDDYFIEDMWA